MILFIRGAHSGYAKQGVFYAPDNAHCPRISMLRSLCWNQPVGETSQYTFSLGLASETLFKKAFPEALTDVATEFDITNKVKFMGHADGLVNDTVYELKSVSSTRTAEQIILDKEPKLGNVLQLLGYMLSLQKQKGMLRYTNYVYHTMTRKKEKVKLEPCNVDFPVEISDEGNVYVAGKLQDFTIENVMESLQIIAKHLEDGTLPHEPVKGDEYWNCCSMCALRAACPMVQSLQELIEAASRVGFIHSELTRA